MEDDICIVTAASESEAGQAGTEAAPPQPGSNSAQKPLLLLLALSSLRWPRLRLWWDQAVASGTGDIGPCQCTLGFNSV